MYGTLIFPVSATNMIGPYIIISTRGASLRNHLCLTAVVSPVEMDHSGGSQWEYVESYTELTVRFLSISIADPVADRSGPSASDTAGLLSTQAAFTGTQRLRSARTTAGWLLSTSPRISSTRISSPRLSSPRLSSLRLSSPWLPSSGLPSSGISSMYVSVHPERCCGRIAVCSLTW